MQKLTQRQKVDQWSPGVREKGEWGISVNGHRASSWGYKIILKLDMATVAQFCEYTKKPLNCQFKRVTYMGCGLYLNNNVMKKRRQRNLR